MSRKGTLLGGRAVLAGDWSEAAEESIDDGTCVKQMFERAECGRGRSRERVWGRGQIGPIGGNQRFTAVRQDQN